MPYERPLRASDSSSVTASVGGAVGAGQQHLELVDHADDPRQRLALAQIGEPGDAGLLVGDRAAAHLGVELAQHGQAVLPVGLDTDRAGVRQPGAVALGRHELGERDALFEVEQVERHLVGAVAGGQAVEHVDQEGGLAGAGPTADHPVWSQVVELQVHRPVAVVADHGGQPRRGLVGPGVVRVVGQQVAQARAGSWRRTGRRARHRPARTGAAAGRRRGTPAR